MDWQSRLISIYVTTSNYWKQGLSCYVERFSNNQDQSISDEEIVTIFINGIISNRYTLKNIYNFTMSHLKEWFPQLGTYEAFVRRLNRVGSVFPVFLEKILEHKDLSRIIEKKKVIDSMPIILAGAKRSSSAKVAKELADKGYCGSKSMYYYGVKLHVIGTVNTGTLPTPEYIGLTSASCNDLTAFKQVVPELFNCDVFGDKAYGDKENNLYYKHNQNLQVATPIKLKKGQKRLGAADKLYSAMVSSIRQPIEAFFGWLQEKSGIQIASKVRSYQGLMVHVFGRMTAGMLMVTF